MIEVGIVGTPKTDREREAVALATPFLASLARYLNQDHSAIHAQYLAGRITATDGFQWYDDPQPPPEAGA